MVGFACVGGAVEIECCSCTTSSMCTRASTSSRGGANLAEALDCVCLVNRPPRSPVRRLYVTSCFDTLCVVTIASVTVMGENKALVARLSGIMITADSIQGLSRYMQLSGPGGAPSAVRAWATCVERLGPEKQLPLLYLANDVLLSSRGDVHHAFVSAFKPILPHAFRTAATKDPQEGAAMTRLTRIWAERGVVPAEFAKMLATEITRAGTADVGADAVAPAVVDSHEVKAHEFSADAGRGSSGGRGSGVSSGAAAAGMRKSHELSIDVESGSAAAVTAITAGTVAEALAEAQRRARLSAAAAAITASAQLPPAGGWATAPPAALAAAEARIRLTLAVARLNAARRAATIARLEAAAAEASARVAAVSAEIEGWAALVAMVRPLAIAAAAGRTIRTWGQSGTDGAGDGDGASSRATGVPGAGAATSAGDISSPSTTWPEAGDGVGATTEAAMSTAHAALWSRDQVVATASRSVGGGAASAAPADAVDVDNEEFDPLMADDWAGGEVAAAAAPTPASTSTRATPTSSRAPAIAPVSPGTTVGAGVASVSSGGALDRAARRASSNSGHDAKRLRGDAGTALGSAGAFEDDGSDLWGGASLEDAVDAAAAGSLLLPAEGTATKRPRVDAKGGVPASAYSAVSPGIMLNAEPAETSDDAAGESEAGRAAGTDDGGGDAPLFVFDPDSAFTGYTFNPSLGRMVATDEAAPAPDEGWRDH